MPPRDLEGDYVCGKRACASNRDASRAGRRRLHAELPRVVCRFDQLDAALGRVCSVTSVASRPLKHEALQSRTADILSLLAPPTVPALCTDSSSPRATRPRSPSHETERSPATSPDAAAAHQNDAHPSVRRDVPRRLVTSDPPTPVVVTRSEWVCRSGRGCRRPKRSLQKNSPQFPQTRTSRTAGKRHDRHAGGPAAEVLDARSVRRNRGWCASGSPQRCMGGIWLSPAS